MGERFVRFNEVNDIKEFVNAACKCPFDIDVIHERIVVDAKSILGMLSLDYGRALKVYVEDDNSNPDFDIVLDKFKAE